MGIHAIVQHRVPILPLGQTLTGHALAPANYARESLGVTLKPLGHASLPTPERICAWEPRRTKRRQIHLSG